ncbi:hypothetical protein, partial [Akkermansia sp. CAG:344]|uniref:hypothetical protein n=1 Tax=Akkermansia sp. CAG:344 TaxID=1262691 RepID=UPI0025C1C543
KQWVTGSNPVGRAIFRNPVFFLRKTGFFHVREKFLSSVEACLQERWNGAGNGANVDGRPE